MPNNSNNNETALVYADAYTDITDYVRWPGTSKVCPIVNGCLVVADTVDIAKLPKQAKIVGEIASSGVVLYRDMPRVQFNPSPLAFHLALFVLLIFAAIALIPSFPKKGDEVGALRTVPAAAYTVHLLQPSSPDPTPIPDLPPSRLIVMVRLLDGDELILVCNQAKTLYYSIERFDRSDWYDAFFKLRLTECSGYAPPVVSFDASQVEAYCIQPVGSNVCDWDDPAMDEYPVEE